MSNLEQVLYDLVRPMVDHPEDLKVEETDGNGKEAVLHVSASQEDIARLIGRKGSMASALRQVMGVASHRENKRVTIVFEQE
jgi:predicted RNA-binding protein YlqC (UPF0109 family)